jgi:hypothetical protein
MMQMQVLEHMKPAQKRVEVWAHVGVGKLQTNCFQVWKDGVSHEQILFKDKKEVKAL